MSTDPWTLGHEAGYAEAVEVMYRAMRDVFEGTVAVFEKQQSEHDCFESRAETIARMREERDAHRSRAEAAEAELAAERDENSRWLRGTQNVLITFGGSPPEDEMESFVTAVADAVHDFEPRTGWDPIMTATLAGAPETYTEDGVSS